MDGLWNQSICLSVLSTPQKGVEKKVKISPLGGIALSSNGKELSV